MRNAYEIFVGQPQGDVDVVGRLILISILDEWDLRALREFWLLSSDRFL
jgi:hypothetical protein